MNTPILAYRVDDLVIDLQRMRVSRGDLQIQLSPLSVDLLIALVREAPSVVTFNALIEKVWSGSVVSPETVTQRVKLLREALGDDPHAPKYIAAVRGRGYRIVATAIPTVASTSALHERVAHSASEPGSSRRASLRWPQVAALIFVCAGVAFSFYLLNKAEKVRAATYLALTRPVRVAVLPLTDLSPERDQQYLADDISQEVMNALARSRGMWVTERVYSFRFRGINRDLRAIGEQLHVDFLLDGSLTRDGESLRITARLVDARTGLNLWADTLDRRVADVLDVQDEIARAVLEALQPRMPGVRGNVSRNPRGG